MKIITVQEALTRKFKRQREIKQLEYHASGHCAHIGKISPGCYTCFVPNRFWINLETGVKCNLKCPYCPSDKRRGELTPKAIHRAKLEILRDSCLKDYNPLKISFSGGGEPLMYMDIITKFMKFFNNIEKYAKQKPWYFLFTNGLLCKIETLLRLRDLGFDEIRFHLGASDFSEEVYKNLRNAAPHFKAIAIETPSWPPHRKKLFEMLPQINDIGVKYLNIVEIEVNRFNYKTISKILPKGEIYQYHEMHLDDGGLTYDIFKEVLKKKYSFSVLDCNSLVKNIQQAPGKWTCHEKVENLCIE